MAASSSRSWLTNSIVLRLDAQLALEPALGRDVEEVVGLVEQQHVVVAAQERLERQPLLLAAAENVAQRPVGDVVEVERRRPRSTHSSQSTSAS